MVSNRLLPERTVDSLLAIEIVRIDPNALIWSPTNYSASPDHILYAPGLHGFVLECKAVTRSSEEAPWRAEIDHSQLDAYADLRARVLYVLTTPPDDLDQPWVRVCTACGGPCRACPRDARSLSFLEPYVVTSPHILRMEPWFSHWTMIVSDRDLRRHLNGAPSLALDGALAGRAGFTRLCHFLDRVRERRVFPPLLAEFGLDNYPDLWTRNDKPSNMTIAALPSFS